MGFLRQNWVALVFMVAVLGSFYASHVDSVNRDRDQRTQLIQGCLRSSERAVLTASYQQKTSDVRRAAGTPKDIKASEEYQKFALGHLALIPTPRGLIEELNKQNFKLHDALILTVEDGRDGQGTPIYKLRNTAREVLREGCAEAYE